MTERHSGSQFNGSEIAIIGMSGRFPRARNLDEFWENLREGVESLSTFSDDELRESGLDPALIGDPAFVRAGMVLEDADLFDAGFFGYSPREAELLDPQQRIFLECAWEALEDAGCDPESCPGAIGVFAGAGLTTYLIGMFSRLGSNVTATLPHFQAMLANDKDFLATRTAYKMNLRGPAITLQTACSTSLVAVHVACQSLWSGECEVALAGGVSVFFPQKSGHLYHQGMIASPDGHCRPFDARAQGTIKGNGAGVVVLKRLSDALADGDAIRAIIRGTAINNDGSLKLGYTAPSVEGQAEVISQALSLAGIDPGTIGYVEAHGTGTALGDPIEIAALTQVFRERTSAKQFCAIGSLKSNVGHLDTAAGVGSLIKTVLALEHKQIPPSLHFERPNPQIDFENSPFFVNSELRDWPDNNTPRRAAVSSFGIGGTNSHVVVEEAPVFADTSQPTMTAKVHLLPLSARSISALKAIALKFEELMLRKDAASLHDICYSASLRRFHHDQRLIVAGRSPDDLIRSLSAYREETFPAEVCLVTGDARLGQIHRHTWESTDASAGQLRDIAVAYVKGGNVDWRTLCSDRGRYVRLPSYPWQRQRYWIEISGRRAAATPLAVHPLLGVPVISPALSDSVFECRISEDKPAYLKDHRVFGGAMMPAACYIEMALAAADRMSAAHGWAVENLSLTEPLRLPCGEDRVVQVIASAQPQAVRIFSRATDSSDWLLHATASLHPRPLHDIPARVPIESVKSQCPQVWSVDPYTIARERGVEYGPAFRGVHRVWYGEQQALAEIRLPDDAGIDLAGYSLHPALLDACLQVAGIAVVAELGTELDGTYLPMAIDSILINKSSERRFWSHVRIDRTVPGQTIRVHIDAFTDDGVVVAALRGLVLKRVAGSAFRHGSKLQTYRIDWKPQPAGPLSSRAGALATAHAPGCRRSWRCF